MRTPKRESLYISSSSRIGCNSSASRNAPRPRRNNSSLVRQLSRSHSVRSSSRHRNSASHSCCQSARSRRGTITPIRRISQIQKRKRVIFVASFIGRRIHHKEHIKDTKSTKNFLCLLPFFAYFVVPIRASMKPADRFSPLSLQAGNRQAALLS